MNMGIYIAIWALLALVVLGMAIYRNLLGIHEPTLHISRSGASVVTQQKKEFNKEELIERWGERLTIIVVAYGLLLAVMYLYQMTERGSLMMR
ncbi:MAG TPA: hypothetical protein VGW33_10280 [Terriglobia bacterium]|nr:hypothetical protein [Terriglobia bacterium]